MDIAIALTPDQMAQIVKHFFVEVATSGIY